MAAFKKGRRKTFDLAILSAVAVMKYDGCHVQDFHALIGGSSGKTGESMETLVVPTEFQALVKPGAKLPIQWNAEMTESLKASLPDNYKRVMAEHFFKSFLRDEIQEPVSKAATALQRKFQVHHTSLDQVKFRAFIFWISRHSFFKFLRKLTIVLTLWNCPFLTFGETSR